MVVWNRGEGRLEVEELPVRAQLAPVYGLHVEDVTGDGRSEVILGGNLYEVKPQAGAYDAGRGVVGERRRLGATEGGDHAREHDGEAVAAGVDDTRVENRHDSRMLQLRGEPNLTEEAIRADGSGQLRMECLDRHLAGVLLIPRDPHGGHAPATDLALDHVPISDQLSAQGHGYSCVRAPREVIAIARGATARRAPQTFAALRFVPGVPEQVRSLSFHAGHSAEHK